MLVFISATLVQAAPIDLNAVADILGAGSVRALALKGTLSTKNLYYFGLESLQSEGTIVLTLSYEAKDPEAKRGHINFLVVTENGLRQYLSGEDLATISIANGAVDDFAPDSNRLKAAFRSSTEESYLVLLYNNSNDEAEYTLSAQGAVLVSDPSGISLPVNSTVAESELQDGSEDGSEDRPEDRPEDGSEGAIADLLPTPTPRLSRTPTRVGIAIRASSTPTGIRTRTPTRVIASTPTPRPTNTPIPRPTSTLTRVPAPTQVPTLLSLIHI